MISINFGESLINALYLRKMRQVDLAKRMGLLPNNISRWTKHKSARIETINRICAVLDMRPSEFIALGEGNEA